MDLDSLGAVGFTGTAYIDNYRQGGSPAAGVSSFEESLRRASAAQAAPHAETPSAADHRFAKIDKTDKLYEQCVELEIFLVKTLISSMRNTVQKSGLIDEGFAGKMYEDMLYDEYA